MSNKTYILTDKQKKAIEAELSKDNRVELIGTKDGIKITRIRRDIVKVEDKRLI